MVGMISLWRTKQAVALTHLSVRRLSHQPALPVYHWVPSWLWSSKLAHHSSLAEARSPLTLVLIRIGEAVLIQRSQRKTTLRVLTIPRWEVIQRLYSWHVLSRTFRIELGSERRSISSSIIGPIGCIFEVTESRGKTDSRILRRDVITGRRRR